MIGVTATIVVCLTEHTFPNENTLIGEKHITRHILTLGTNISHDFVRTVEQ